MNATHQALNEVTIPNPRIHDQPRSITREHPDRIRVPKSHHHLEAAGVGVMAALSLGSILAAVLYLH